MIDSLVHGRVVGAMTQRIAKNGTTFVTGKVRVVTRDAEPIYANVISFSATVVTALLALGDGDSVALSGELTPKIWTTKEGVARVSFDLFAHAVLSPYDVKRRRKASSTGTKESRETEQPPEPTADGAEFGDTEIPF